MIFGMTFYQICWYFLIYSFLGWVVEVIYHAVTRGKVINRGFLNGPVCPIYGFGVLSVFALINLLKNLGLPMNSFWIFVFGCALATLIELFGGWLLDKFFHARWWDYSDRPMNLNGYICVQFSILWGIAILIVVKIFQGFIEKQSLFVNASKPGWIAAAILMAVYFADLILTVAVIRGFNQKLGKLEKISGEIRAVSDKLSSAVGNRTISVAQKIGEERVQANLAKMEWRDSVNEKKDSMEKALLEKQEKLQKHFDEIASSMTSNSLFGTGRILKAFPGMKHRMHSGVIEMLKKKMK